ncbi:MAG: efflux transporter outer membrane subunit [Geobacteraceae bacterium]|nr:efflux transporter outer membrane subunit [Geobacteraceae bacterium]
MFGLFSPNCRNLAAVLLAASLLSGCSLLPRSEFRQPQVSVPEKWQNQAATGTAVANGTQWWKNFNDPVLDQLIDRALRTNNDLAAATVKVKRAQLQSKLTDTNLTPNVNVTASSVGTLAHGELTQSHSVTGALSYELDLWGKLARARDADRWEAEATEADRQNTALSLIGTTASAYWQVAFLNQRIDTEKASIAYAEKTLDLVKAKYRAGAVSALDLAQAEQTVATQKANLTQLEQQRTEARNALAILFDQAPENAVSEREALPDGPLPAVKAGMPVSLLGRRPDLRAAELRLREYLADTDYAKASFYPSFTLTGSAGGSSISLENVLRNPVTTLGVGLALPFVQWNTARLTVKISETHYEEAVVNFRQTLYKALSDVENALSAQARYEEERVQLEQALSSARKAELLSEIRYRAGATGVQDWLDEQERRRSAETTLDENRLNRLKNIMKLYQALGGDMKTAPAT